MVRVGETQVLEERGKVGVVALKRAGGFIHRYRKGTGLETAVYLYTEIRVSLMGVVLLGSQGLCQVSFELCQTVLSHFGFFFGL